MTEELRVWPRHIYTVRFGGRVGYCASAARVWFAQQGLSWSDFIANGIEAQRLLATGNPLAAAVVAHAEAERRG